jgi:hypothetical protein
MLTDSWTNILNIVLAGAVVVMGLNDQGKFHKVILYIMIAAAVLGIAELLNITQAFPDRTWMSDLVHERDIPVLLLLLLAVSKLKEAKGK